MSQFERDLRESLRRREPPPGFAGKVIARAHEIDKRRETRSFWMSSWRWVTAAAAVVMLIAGISVYQEHRRQVEARQSKEQLILALQITGSKMRVVQERLSVIQRKSLELHLQQ
jgi:anti-sigma-K factor RskA